MLYLYLLLIPVIGASIHEFSDYLPDWNSIDSRPLPSWYDNSKFGIFMHWGVFSVPAYGSEWFWHTWKVDKNPDFQKFVNEHFSPTTTYADFAKWFTAEDFNAKKFADIIQSSGARYFVLTSKHHEGFTLWPSNTSWNWNSVDVGPKLDLVSELEANIRAAGIHFGLYFSLMDWFHPLYVNDGVNGKSDYVQSVQLPQLNELVEKYRPDIIWTDGDWERSDNYWKSKEFIAWLYNQSPIKENVVINDRWGIGIVGKHGGIITNSDEYDPGVLISRKWENCLKLDRYSWGFRRNIEPSEVLTAKEVIIKLARTISCNGNLLLNIGPDSFGRIPPLFQERLQQIGFFVRTNNEAIFGSKPWIYQNESESIWYTSKVQVIQHHEHASIYNRQETKNTIIYAFILDIPADLVIRLNSIKLTTQTKVSLLGTSYQFNPIWSDKKTLIVHLSDVSWQKWPSTEALVLKIENAGSDLRIPPMRQNLKE